MLREVPFGTKVEGKREGVFIAFTAWSRIYENYEDPTMTDEYRASLFPLVLMMHRWDGAIGFVGGFIDKGRSIEEQAEIEAEEEVGVDRHKITLLPLIAHETDRMVVNLYRLDVSDDSVYGWIEEASLADHSVAEGNAFWAHLADYGRGAGWERLRNSNSLSTAVGEELDAIRAWMYANAPEGAYMVPSK
jgi:ADP-ribose pyrophosphatase YjhB (NUDIX family)